MQLSGSQTQLISKGAAVNHYGHYPLESRGSLFKLLVAVCHKVMIGKNAISGLAK